VDPDFADASLSHPGAEDPSAQAQISVFVVCSTLYTPQQVEMFPRDTPSEGLPAGHLAKK
jgi:hypothetical protein